MTIDTNIETIGSKNSNVKGQDSEALDHPADYAAMAPENMAAPNTPCALDTSLEPSRTDLSVAK